jgi:hypothetical protein
MGFQDFDDIDPETPVDGLYAAFSGHETYGDAYLAAMSGMMPSDASVYLGDGIWIRPDGAMRDEDSEDDGWYLD